MSSIRIRISHMRMRLKMTVNKHTNIKDCSDEQSFFITFAKASVIVDQILQHFVGNGTAHFGTITAVFNDNNEGVRIVFVV